MKRFIRGLMAAVLAAPMVAGMVLSTAPKAAAEDNGVGATPALGWSSWSFVRQNPTASTIEAQADAMRSSGLAGLGYQYVNVDDFWYQCPGGQGPNVDQYGRWATDTAKFPSSGSEDGIQVVADHVHADGLKFGLYVTPGISKQAVAQNTPILGTGYHAADIATTAGEANYNCGGMTGIDYTKPGAQAFINSWADEFASWGVDYVKIDGVGTWDVPDVQAWSAALRQTGRPIHLELSNGLSIGSASVWQQSSNGWRTGGDVECYCSSSSYPLTNWGNVSSRFDQVAAWQPYGGPGAFNDYDSLELGNGSNDGLTPDERQTQMSLWALASSPLILGTDLTNLDPLDLSYLKNQDVIAVDQDAIDASRISQSSTSQVFAKTEKNGDVIIGLFNTGTEPETVSTTAATLGLPAATDYVLDNLWTHSLTETAGAVSAEVPSHGVALYRVRAGGNPSAVAPSVTLDVSGLTTVTSGQSATATATFTDDGVLPAQNVTVSLQAPKGWTVTPTSPVHFGAVQSGQRVQSTFTVTTPAPTSMFTTNQVSGSAGYTWHGRVAGSASVTDTVSTTTPVGAPLRTFASTTAAFGQLGTELGIRAAGADVWYGTNEYGAIYRPGAEHDGSTTTVEILSQANTDAWAKAGIMVRNDITDANGSPGFLMLAETPGHGYVLQWDSDGNGQIDSNSSPPNSGLGSGAYPSWLKLVRSGTTYTGYYSTDDVTWTLIAAANLPSAAATQDVGVFATSHSAGTIGEVDYNDFTTS